MDNSFKLDRTQFGALTFEQADAQISDFKSTTRKERLTIANQLIAVAYNFSLEKPPVMDKTYFEARSVKNGRHI